MKEVTRIHIAKTSYDVELEAKKALENYLKALEKYSGDTEIMLDIEIRITEILAERGVKKDQVITVDDVKALREQLGEPKEFKPEDGDEISENEDMSEPVGRKLFRDTDNAVVGGVLSGLAAFFGVNPALVRVLFVLLMLMSFGTALLVYALLWAVVPPARTAADKLQMRGLSVTIASIREVNETVVSRRPRMDAETRKTLLTLAGVLCTIAAACTVLFTIMAGLGIFFNRYHAFSEEIATSQLLLGALIAAICSGLLLASLFGVLAYAAFVRKMTKRTIVSICIVVSLGFLSFCTAVGLTQYSVFKIRYESDTNSQVILPQRIHEFIR
jgi:phage shock protein PspC (stress-responsive transcriptional regulator)